MQPSMPFMFIRRKGTFGDGNVNHSIYVVKLATYWDLKHYNSGWMDDSVLGDGSADSVFVPDVDITEQQWVFDSSDSLQNELNALSKMKELWAAMEIPTAKQIRGE